MKNLIAGIVFIAFVFVGCEPAATFDQPQPAEKKSLVAFPDRVFGDYLSSDQASMLSITNNMLTRTYDFDYKVFKDSLPHDYKLDGDSLVDTTNGTKEKVLVKADTVVQHLHWIDTLFSISSDNVLKEFKGYYFLNIRYGDKEWIVQKLSLQNGSLTLANISDKDDINRLQAITGTSSDTTSRHFSLTRKQFKSFVKQHGFSDEEVFTKVDRNTIKQIAQGSFL